MIKFKLVTRAVNRTGSEYALMVEDEVTSTRYCVFTWENKPSDDEVAHTVHYLRHAMNFYREITPKAEADIDYTIEIGEIK